MQHRQNGASQEVAAAKAGVSVRSGRRIETSGQKPCINAERQWRTREDPLEAVWETELLHLLENEPKLTGTTLLDYLQEHYPEHYDQTILRTLQRRVKQWRALHGPEREVIFRQQAVVAQQGFLILPTPITRLRFNPRPFHTCSINFDWPTAVGARSPSFKVASYAALATGLQRALQQVGGSPIEHRTDSLSAARNNRQNVWTEAYSELCQHYRMTPTRNNLGQSHENGVVECANGSLKKRLAQQLLLRGHSDFDDVAHYQTFIDRAVDKLNQRNRSRVLEEQATLQPLPEFTAAEYQTLHLKVTRSSTIEVRRVVYTVPSRLIGESVQIRLHHDKLVLFVGQQPALTLPRIYPQAWRESRPQRQLPARYSLAGLEAAGLPLLSVA